MAVRILYVSEAESKNVDLDKLAPKGTRVGDCMLVVATDPAGRPIRCAVVAMAEPTDRHALKRMITVPIQNPVTDALGCLVADLDARLARLERPALATLPEAGAAEKPS
jgi:hypothetical protein